MGSKSDDNGRRWERYVRAECRDIKRARRAMVSKNWEAPKVPGEHTRIEPSKPDFSGILPSGRHIIFEAKSTESTTSFSFDQISKHQWESLDLAHEWGSAAFIYVVALHRRRERDGLPEKWVFPWTQVLSAKSLGKSSIPFEIDDFQKRLLTNEHGEPIIIKGRMVTETWLDTWQRLDEGGLT